MNVVPGLVQNSTGRCATAILAGGLGTRLAAAGLDQPKVLAPVAERPFPSRILDWLGHLGLRRVVLCTGYRASDVRRALGDRCGEIELLHSPEPAPLGTGGALRHALPHLAAGPVLVLNGDSFCPLDLDAFERAHLLRPAHATIAVSAVPDVRASGSVALGRDDRVVGFREKDPAGGAGLANAGVYLIERTLIERIPADRPVSLERELLPAWLARYPVFAFRSGAAFHDIGTPERWAAAGSFIGKLTVGGLA